jgi:hypothetical protein
MATFSLRIGISGYCSAAIYAALTDFVEYTLRHDETVQPKFPHVLRVRTDGDRFNREASPSFADAAVRRRIFAPAELAKKCLPAQWHVAFVAARSRSARLRARPVPSALTRTTMMAFRPAVADGLDLDQVVRPAE